MQPNFIKAFRQRLVRAGFTDIEIYDNYNGRYSVWCTDLNGNKIRVNMTKEEIIKKTKYENVDLITRGAEVYNSSLVFISEKFKNFIADLRNEYDFVLLDCAPVLLVSDYIHISEVSDGILFMVAHGITTKSQVSEAVKELNKNNAEILGAVFTMYDRKRTKYYNGYSYKKYYKYSYSAYVRDDDEDEQTENTQVQESKAKE